MKTFLAPNEFISNPSVIRPRTERSAAASSLVRADAGAAAAPFHSSCGDGKVASIKCSATGVDPTDTFCSAEPEVAPGPQEAESSTTMEVPSEASAPAPTKNPDADALEATDHIHEIFFYVRKLMKRPPRFVLDQASFLADTEETPLFVRAGDHLRRWSA